MASRGVKPMESEHINVTPLIDIIMCLIIFFLLVGHIAKAASVKGVKIPTAKNGKDIHNKSNLLIINLVPPGGQFTQDNAPAIWIWGTEVPYNQLAAYLRGAERKNKTIKVVLRADRAIPYKFVAPVLFSCAQANIASIHFMTRRPG